MRIWRDIFPLATWTEITQKLTNPGRKAEWDRAGDEKKTAQDWLKKLTSQIRDYHAIKKTDRKKLTKRADALKRIACDAYKFLMYYCDSMTPEGQAAWKTRVVGKRDGNGRLTASDPLKESLERDVLSLAKRGARKAAYLVALDRVCQDKNVRDAAKFLKYLKNPAKPPEGLLAPGDNVRLEVVDPAHRSFEGPSGQINLENAEWRERIQMSGELADNLIRWFETLPRHKKTFFLWLEGQPCCLGEKSADISHDNSVGYVGDNVQGRALTHLRMLVFEQPLRVQMTNFGGHDPQATADTSTYSAANAKGPNNSGQGVAAFAWLQDKTVLIGEHKEHCFHHTSFAAGNFVRCAGMIKIMGGRVVWVSNNSGHYKPKQQHLAEFLRFLLWAGATTPRDQVCCMGLQQPFEGSINSFLFRQADGDLINA